DAGARLEAAPRVVDAGMDDLAVARGGLEADAVFAFEHHDLDAGARQRPRHREPDHPGADDDAFDRFRHDANSAGNDALSQAAIARLNFLSRLRERVRASSALLSRRLQQPLDRRGPVAPPFA